MINNNIASLSSTSISSSVSNSSPGSTGGNTSMSLAAANVVRGIMEKVLATPPMGSTMSTRMSPASLSTSARCFNEFDYLASPGLDSDFGDTSPLLCVAPNSSNLNNQYLRLPICSNNNNSNNKEQQQQHCYYGNFPSR